MDIDWGNYRPEGRILGGGCRRHVLSGNRFWRRKGKRISYRRQARAHRGWTSVHQKTFGGRQYQRRELDGSGTVRKVDDVLHEGFVKIREGEGTNTSGKLRTPAGPGTNTATSG